MDLSEGVTVGCMFRSIEDDEDGDTERERSMKEANMAGKRLSIMLRTLFSNAHGSFMSVLGLGGHEFSA